MALTNIVVGARSDRDKVIAINLQFNADNAYVAGGTPDFTDILRAAVAAVAAAATDANVRGAETLEILNVIPGYCGVRYQPAYDKANDKLVMIDTNAAPHIDAAPGDLSGTTVQLTCVCK